MTYKVTLPRARQMVEDAVAAHPRRQNPRSMGTCVYTNRPKNSHCIIGQVIVDVGLPLIPITVFAGIDLVWRGQAMESSKTKDEVEKPYPRPDITRTFTRHAIEWLQKVQDVFDDQANWYKGADMDSRPNWSQALKHCKGKSWYNATEMHGVRYSK
jgi:hypothetical protein